MSVSGTNIQVGPEHSRTNWSWWGLIKTWYYLEMQRKMRKQRDTSFSCSRRYFSYLLSSKGQLNWQSTELVHKHVYLYVNVGSLVHNFIGALSLSNYKIFESCMMHNFIGKTSFSWHWYTPIWSNLSRRGYKFTLF